MDKCQRCNSKKATVNCAQCEKFRSLCERCDAYVHNLPGKKEHNRVSVFQNEQQGVNTGNVSNKGPNTKDNYKGMVIQGKHNDENEQVSHNDFDNNINSNTQVNNYVIPSKGMNIRNERVVPQHQEEQQFNYFNNANIINNSNGVMDNNIMINSNNSQIPNDNNNNLISSISERNKPFSYSSIYSRDYLAELKVIVYPYLILCLYSQHMLKIRLIFNAKVRPYEVPSKKFVYLSTSSSNHFHLS